MKNIPPFENKMSWGRTLFGLIYLPIHIIVLPLLIPGIFYGLGITDLAMINVYYYAFSLALVLIVFFRYLRENFDPLVDRFFHCLITLFMGLGIYYIGNVIINLVVLGFGITADNPNDQMVTGFALDNNAFRAAAIFMGPIVEEVLFRGALFGGVRKKNRVLAYVLSIAIFALTHVWQYVMVEMDMTILIYVLQYIPVGFALAWVYERSGSIWVPIGMHMLVNSMSLAAADLLAEMM